MMDGHSAYLGRERLLREIRLVPNIISIGRVILVIPIAFLYASPSQAASWVVLALLSVTYLSDYADGYLARRLNQESRLGLILDPLADKLWTLMMLILLFRYRDLPVWIMVSLVGRDVLILGMNLVCLKRLDTVMTSDEMGRKYMVLAGLMIIGYTLRLAVAVWIAYLLVVLAVYTCYRYYRRYRRLYAGRAHPSEPESVVSSQG